MIDKGRTTYVQALSGRVCKSIPLSCSASTELPASGLDLSGSPEIPTGRPYLWSPSLAETLKHWNFMWVVFSQEIPSCNTRSEVSH